jgi:hypothetical protein
MKIEKYTLAIFLFCSALLTTLWNYQFGQMDHVEHLPILFRAENAEYLRKDSFLNAFSQNYDPRFYYTRLILILKQLFPLPLLFFLLTFFINYLIAFSTYRIANQLFSNEKWAGLMAVFLVLTVSTIELGSVAEIHTEYLTPNALAFSLILLALSFVFSKKWVLAGLLLGLASLIHPLAGPESALLFFSYAALEQLATNKFQWKKYSAFLIGAFIFAMFATLSLAPFFLNKSDGLDAKTFIGIYAHFRAPHHIIPSIFMHPAERNLAIKLLILLFFAWFAFVKIKNKEQRFQYNILIYIIILVLLALAGYVFVEIYPVKIVVIAQTFRLLYLLKFFLLLLLGGYIGYNLQSGTQLNKVYALAALISSFALPNLIWIFGLWGFSSLLHRRINLPQAFLFVEIAAILSLGGYGFYLSWQNLEQSANVYLWAFMLLFLPLLSMLNLSRIQMYIWPLATILVFGYWGTHQRIETMKPLQKALSRQYSLNDLPSSQLELAKKIRELTPDSSILLVPPMFGELRYLANRALLVTFKTLPFGGKQMISWKEAVFDCYGWTDLKGFNAVLYSFEPNYKKIDKERLKMLNSKYGADYAVLYTETETVFPVLFENKQYKLIYIDKVDK